MSRLARTLVFCVGLMSGVAHGGRQPGPFSYEFLGADIFRWLDGRASGPVEDECLGMGAAFRRLLTDATDEVDLAIYGVSSQDWLFRELGRLDRQGIRLRTVVDQLRGRVGDWDPELFVYGDTPRLARLLGPERVHPDASPGGRIKSSIMHNKFAVTDSRRVWLGSTNLSHTGIGAEYNANVSLIIDSAAIATWYVREFDQMYEGGRFGRDKDRDSREPVEFSDGTIVEGFFSPQDDPVAGAVLPFIDAARETLDIGMFYLTDLDAAEALERAVERGVRVRLILDAVAAAHPASRHPQIRAAGGKVRIENWGGKMHMKAAVADGRHTLIGSMNWTAAGSAENDENTLVIRENRKLAREMAAYFQSLWRSLDDAPQRPRAESTESVNSCADGIDNDYDGKVDRADSGC